jgi:hypothetical protein
MHGKESAATGEERLDLGFGVLERNAVSNLDQGRQDRSVAGAATQFLQGEMLHAIRAALSCCCQRRASFSIRRAATFEP